MTVVTPRQLYFMKKDTVRPKDRMDAEAPRRLKQEVFDEGLQPST